MYIYQCVGDFSGLTNYFRDYEPGTGRYLESDPIGLRGGWNTFSYTNNQPTKMTDKLGLRGGILRSITRLILPWLFNNDSRNNSLSTSTDLEHYKSEECDTEKERCKKVKKSCIKGCSDFVLGKKKRPWEMVGLVMIFQSVLHFVWKERIVSRYV